MSETMSVQQKVSAQIRVEGTEIALADAFIPVVLFLQNALAKVAEEKQ